MTVTNCEQLLRSTLIKWEKDVLCHTLKLIESVVKIDRNSCCKITIKGLIYQVYLLKE